MNNNDYWNHEFFDGRDIIEVQDLIYGRFVEGQLYSPASGTSIVFATQAPE